MVRFESVSTLQIKICPAMGSDTGNINMFQDVTVYTCMQNDVSTCITQSVINYYKNDKLSTYAQAILNHMFNVWKIDM